MSVCLFVFFVSCCIFCTRASDISELRARGVLGREFGAVVRTRRVLTTTCVCCRWTSSRRRSRRTSASSSTCPAMATSQTISRTSQSVSALDLLLSARCGRADGLLADFRDKFRGYHVRAFCAVRDRCGRLTPCVCVLVLTETTVAQGAPVLLA